MENGFCMYTLILKIFELLIPCIIFFNQLRFYNYQRMYCSFCLNLISVHYRNWSETCNSPKNDIRCTHARTKSLDFIEMPCYAPLLFWYGCNELQFLGPQINDCYCICIRHHYHLAIYTLFTERKLHLISPFALMPLGRWPWLMVLMILSNCLGSNVQKTPFSMGFLAKVSPGASPILKMTKGHWP